MKNNENQPINHVSNTTYMTRQVYHDDQFFKSAFFWVYAFAFIVFLINLFVFWSVLFESSLNFLEQTNSVQFYALNVGQGDALYFEFPIGQSMLIDSGNTDKKVIEELSKIKNIFDKNIDVVLITHADADHIGSMESVIDRFAPRLFLHSGVAGKSTMYKKLMELVKVSSSTIKNILLYDGMIIRFKNFVEPVDLYEPTLEILHPNFLPRIDRYIECMKLVKGNAVKSKSKNTFKKCNSFLQFETNEYSIVARLVYGSSSIMLTGDASVESETDIISTHNQDQLKSTVLKVGHHGSKTSTSQSFIDLVQPKYAVVSVGEHNRYGHPSQDVLGRITDYFGNTSHSESIDGIYTDRILRTDIENTIHFVLDGVFAKRR